MTITVLTNFKQEVLRMKCSKCKKNKTDIEIWNLIHQLSDIRARYSLFDESEKQKYHACSIAIDALREIVDSKENNKIKE